jgi:hypothetical protein
MAHRQTPSGEPHAIPELPMTTRNPRRAPARRKRKRAGRVRRKGAADAASRLPHHPRYTAALLAQVRQRFEDTPEPIPSMAADLGVAPQSLHRIARRYGWVRRNPVPPPRDVSQASQILQEAQVLAGEAPPTPDPSPPFAALTGGGERTESAASNASHDTEPASSGLSTIERLERAVLAELATIEAMRAALGTLPQKPAGAARTLSMLTQTLQHLQRLRASAALTAKPVARSDHDDDDMPADIDEFRRDLARRIDAFVASRTERSDAGRDPDAAPVDEIR